MWEKKKKKSHFGLIWAKGPVGRREKSKKGEKKRKERKKKEKKKKEIKRYVFIMESNVFWMFRAFRVNFYGELMLLGLGFWKRSPKP